MNALVHAAPPPESVTQDVVDVEGMFGHLHLIGVTVRGSYLDPEGLARMLDPTGVKDAVQRPFRADAELIHIKGLSLRSSPDAPPVLLAHDIEIRGFQYGVIATIKIGSVRFTHARLQLDGLIAKGLDVALLARALALTRVESDEELSPLLSELKFDATLQFADALFSSRVSLAGISARVLLGPLATLDRGTYAEAQRRLLAFVDDMFDSVALQKVDVENLTQKVKAPTDRIDLAHMVLHDVRGGSISDVRLTDFHSLQSNYAMTIHTIAGQRLHLKDYLMTLFADFIHADYKRTIAPDLGSFSVEGLLFQSQGTVSLASVSAWKLSFPDRALRGADIEFNHLVSELYPSLNEPMRSLAGLGYTTMDLSAKLTGTANVTTGESRLEGWLSGVDMGKLTLKVTSDGIAKDVTAFGPDTFAAVFRDAVMRMVSMRYDEAGLFRRQDRYDSLRFNKSGHQRVLDGLKDAMRSRDPASSVDARMIDFHATLAEMLKFVDDPHSIEFRLTSANGVKIDEVVRDLPRQWPKDLQFTLKSNVPPAQ